MKSNIFKSKFLVTAVLCLALTLSATDAFAEGRGSGGHGGGGRGGYEGGGHRGGGERYSYRGGRWYRSGWFWFDAGVTALAIGAIASSLPPRHETIVVGGVPYYCYENAYFKQYPTGYVVVPPPVPAPVIVTMPVQAPFAQPVIQGAETVVINIPNSNGSYTAVTLIRRGNGYAGPQGEYYSTNPTVEQLRAMYGK
jgi:hypothetical protein